MYVYIHSNFEYFDIHQNIITIHSDKNIFRNYLIIIPPL